MPLIYISLFIGIFWHLQAVWHQHLFGDEIHSLFFMENNGFLTLLAKPIEPIHPNLSYLVFKTVYSLSPQVLTLRLLMFVIFLASCYIFWLILDHFFKNKKQLSF